MDLLFIILYLVAFVCFVLTALGVAVARINLLGLGLACWVLVSLIKAF